MKIRFLGTGTSGGVPLIGCDCEVCSSVDSRDKRLRTSLLIQSGDTSVTIDCGPDFRQQMLDAKVKQLDAILMTHAHRDHSAGLDDVRSFNFLTGKPIEVYCDEWTETGIREQFSYVFKPNDYPHLPQILLKRIGQEAFFIDQLKVEPFQVMHGKYPITAFKLGALTYITDASFISEDVLEWIQGSEVLVLNALRPQPHYSHYTIEQAISIAQKVKATKTYFIHMSHQAGLHAHLSMQLPENIYLAYDGLELEV